MQNQIYYLFVLFFIVIIFLIEIYCEHYLKKLNQRYFLEGERIVSIADLYSFTFLSLFSSILMFFMIFAGYGTFCVSLGLIDDGLLELNDYVSFFPLILPNDYDQYTEPIHIFRFLNKFNISLTVLGAFLLSQCACFIISRLIFNDVKKFKDRIHVKCYILSVSLNIIVWFSKPLV